MRCNECGADNMEGADPCWECGAPLRPAQERSSQYGWVVWALLGAGGLAIAIMLGASGPRGGAATASPTGPSAVASASAGATPSAGASGSVGATGGAPGPSAESTAAAP